MMQVIVEPPKERWARLLTRPQQDRGSLTALVNEIITNVRQKGDSALLEYSMRYDGIQLNSLRVTDEELSAAQNEIDTDLKHAISQAAENIRKFHFTQLDTAVVTETMPGVKCWRKSVGIQKVGLYIPGGTAPLFSTLLMLRIPAQLAGCKELVVCTPPNKDGTVHPAILYAASIIGVSQIFKTGGAQAIAAMAFGTETVPQVYKIFGPGNQYVTAAKEIIQQYGTAIDMPAGPSELCILADETAVPDFIAADLLSQAEHGADSQVLLVCTSEELSDRVNNALTTQLAILPRRDIAEKALENSKVVVFRDMATAIELVNEYAPEHLIITCKNAEATSEAVLNAGSVFIGNYSPESAGDYASGTNHTLPTNGYAKAYSGVSVESFVKKITFQMLTKEGLQNIRKTVVTMAEAEGLQAHANAVNIRIKD